MPLPSPNLDDRNFDQLVEEALAVVRQNSTTWTDLSPGDPGVVLIEAFAHLTEMMIYRLNRLPDKVFVALLNLIGVQPHPPSASSVTLTFSLAKPQKTKIEIPMGTRVTAPRSNDGSESPVFETLSAAVLDPGKTDVAVRAAHCQTIKGELCGTGTGRPGQSVRVAQVPIIEPNLPGSNLLVGIETDLDRTRASDSMLEFDGKAFAIWREVQNFDAARDDRRVYVVNRFTGEITFAPALRTPKEDGGLRKEEKLLADVPQTGQQIRVWYRTGGGSAGNIRPGMLKTLVEPIGGLAVTNQVAALGGSPAETLENAIARGPMSLHSLERAVTARDFEALAKQSSGGVNRARAIADAALWKHGAVGAVNITLVPDIENPPSPVTSAVLMDASPDTVLEQVQKGLDRRRPLGTSCLVGWAHYKTVRVKADVTVYPGEDPEVMHGHLLEKLNHLITPLADGSDQSGWPFGKPITTWDVLRQIGRYAGVASIGNVRLLIDKAPNEDIDTITRDAFQPHTWYTASKQDVYRSGNDGDSWEAIRAFEEQEVVLVDAYTPESGNDPGRAGLICVITRQDETLRLYVSRNCGNSFEEIGLFQFEVTDVTWMFRDRTPSLFMASPSGLFEVALQAGSAPQQILFDEKQPTLGANAVVVSTDLQGQNMVAVAGSGEAGVYLSVSAGRAGTFQHIGLDGELARILMVQHTRTQRYLWAGVSAAGRAGGNGCFRIRLDEDGADIDGWTNYAGKWSAGTCRSLSHDGNNIYAGSLRRGVLCLAPDDPDPEWRLPSVSCGLPLRDVSRLQPINALAAAPGIILAGGPEGIHRSTDIGICYKACSVTEFYNEVKLPETWVFCSGAHEITVRRSDDPSAH